jgi:ubiquinone/menaquinone biosynthesis C-methylase UbiE
VDIDENLVEHSNQFAKKKGIFNAQFKIADLSSLPFESDTFDVVFLNDVVEHIRRPALTRVFEECRRVVKSDGRICLEFPPWSNWSAAHLYDYIYIPWCQFLFSDETLINVIRRMNPGHGFGRLSVIEHFKELNHVTVAEVMKISKKLDLKIIHSEMRMIKGKNYLKHIPLLNKYMVSRFVAVLAK